MDEKQQHKNNNNLNDGISKYFVMKEHTLATVPIFPYISTFICSKYWYLNESFLGLENVYFQISVALGELSLRGIKLTVIHTLKEILSQTD